MTRRMMRRKGWALSGGWRHYGAAGWMDRWANATALFSSHLIVIKLLSWLQVFLKLLRLKSFKELSIKYNIVPSTPRRNFVFTLSIYNILVQKYLMIVWLVRINFSKKRLKLVAISSLLRYSSIVTFDDCLIFAWPVDQNILISIV